MKIALASPPMPKTISEGLQRLEKLTHEAAEKQAEIICFPESYVPGYPIGYEVEERTPKKMQQALEKVCKIAAEHHIAIILPMDWFEDDKMFNVAFVISATGEVLGYQTKNQLDPSEDNLWIPGTERSIYEINGVKFGIVICHEGFRYPELVRWAARDGASVVFHPHCGGSDVSGFTPTEWGAKENPYYEKAAMLRAMENTIYFASVNYCFKYPDSASAVIDPDGKCLVHQPYGEPGIVIAEIDPAKATALLAKRFKPELLRA